MDLDVWPCRIAESAGSCHSAAAWTERTLRIDEMAHQRARAAHREPFAPPSPYRFEVAISFAGDEKRPVVRTVAELLRDRLGSGKVFFDEWFEAELAGHDAQIVLQAIYRKQTRLVVMCVCQRYNEKPWPQEEWRAIQAFERNLRDAGAANNARLRLLPLRFGEGDVDGVLETAIVPDVRARTPEEIAALIIDRLQLIHGVSVDTAPVHRNGGNDAQTRGPRFRRLVGLSLAAVALAAAAAILIPWPSHPRLAASSLDLPIVAPEWQPLELPVLTTRRKSPSPLTRKSATLECRTRHLESFWRIICVCDGVEVANDRLSVLPSESAGSDALREAAAAYTRDHRLGCDKR